MNNNSIVMAEHVCDICGKRHTHNAEILIHKNLRAIPQDKRVTGWGLCEEHDRLFNEGYIALVGALAPKSGTTLKNEDAHRTGDIIHLKREVFKETFDANISDDLPMVFVEPEVVKLITGWFNETEG